jgi:hypothetical protein
METTTHNTRKMTKPDEAIVRNLLAGDKRALDEYICSVHAASSSQNSRPQTVPSNMFSNDQLSLFRKAGEPRANRPGTVDLSSQRSRVEEKDRQDVEHLLAESRARTARPMTASLSSRQLAEMKACKNRDLNMRRLSAAREQAIEVMRTKAIKFEMQRRLANLEELQSKRERVLKLRMQENNGVDTMRRILARFRHNPPDPSITALRPPMQPIFGLDRHRRRPPSAGGALVYKRFIAGADVPVPQAATEPVKLEGRRRLLTESSEVVQ